MTANPSPSHPPAVPSRGKLAGLAGFALLITTACDQEKAAPTTTGEGYAAMSKFFKFFMNRPHNTPISPRINRPDCLQLCQQFLLELL